MAKSKEEIEKELIVLLTPIIDVEPEEITSKAHFFHDWAIDSLKHMEIFVVILKHFGVDVIREEQLNLVTIKDVAELIYGGMLKLVEIY